MALPSPGPPPERPPNTGSPERAAWIDAHPGGPARWQEWVRQEHEYIKSYIREGYRIDQVPTPWDPSKTYQDAPDEGQVAYRYWSDPATVNEEFHEERTRAEGAGHLTRYGNNFFNVGSGNPQDPSTWQWLDSNYNNTSPPGNVSQDLVNWVSNWTQDSGNTAPQPGGTPWGGGGNGNIGNSGNSGNNVNGQGYNYGVSGAQGFYGAGGYGSGQGSYGTSGIGPLSLPDIIGGGNFGVTDYLNNAIPNVHVNTGYRTQDAADLGAAIRTLVEQGKFDLATGLWQQANRIRDRARAEPDLDYQQGLDRAILGAGNPSGVPYSMGGLGAPTGGVSNINQSGEGTGTGTGTGTGSRTGTGTGSPGGTRLPNGTVIPLPDDAQGGLPKRAPDGSSRVPPINRVPSGYGSNNYGTDSLMPDFGTSRGTGDDFHVLDQGIATDIPGSGTGTDIQQEQNIIGTRNPPIVGTRTPPPPPPPGNDFHVLETGGNKTVPPELGPGVGASFGGGGGGSAPPQGVDARRPELWAYLADPAQRIASQYDQADQAIKRMLPRGGAQDTARAQGIQNKYAGVADLWRGQVSDALNRMQARTSSLMFQQPVNYFGGAQQGANAVNQAQSNSITSNLGQQQNATQRLNTLLSPLNSLLSSAGQAVAKKA